MCGIFGYIGARELKEALIESLRRLEYRGYDSAGIAIVNENSIYLNKVAGKIDELASKVNFSIPIYNTCGIAHTRWATHGSPTKRNAHPHTDCKGNIAVVHNGIIENYLELKVGLLQKGHVFDSETDSEVIPHLVEEYYTGDLEEAVRKSVQRLRGAYAICVISTKEPDKIVVARNGSPLVIGVGDVESFASSDITPILRYTKRVVFVEDGEMAVIKRDSIRVTTIEGEVVKPVIQEINWDAAQAERGGYKYFMLKEIFEQPKIMKDTLYGRLDENGDIKFHQLEDWEDHLRSLERISIVACGTSYHAGLVSKYFIEEIAGIPVDVDVGSEYRYRCTLPGKNSLVIAISQSGETADTLGSLRKIKDRVNTLAISNVVGSTLERGADRVINVNAGPEIGVASTKAYTAQLMTMYLLGLYIAEIRGRTDIQEYSRELLKMNEYVEMVLKEDERIKSIASKYNHYDNAMYIGRTYNYPSALEGALKLKEISYVNAIGYPAGELKHGPIALLNNNFPVVAINPNSPVYDKMLSNIQEIKARDAKVIALATAGNGGLNELCDDVIPIPEVKSAFSPIPVAVAEQLLAYYIADMRGIDVDKPRNLAKSVTVE